MTLLLRHPVSMVIVLVAMATTMSVFVFARPQYRPQFENPPFDMTKEHVYSRAEVLEAFAAHDLRLERVAHIGGREGGVTTYATEPVPLDTKAFYVYYAGPKAKGSWGDPDIAKDAGEYEVRFGNLLVHYGGSDERMLARVKSAVDDLR